MNAETFCEQFATFAEAPNGVARLRQMIFQLAIQGRLVSQDPKDEPADSLVDEIAKFKQEATGRSPKITRLDSTAAGFPLRQGWVATTFGDIMLNRDGERVPVSREIREGRKGPYDYYGASGVIDCIDEFLFDKPLLLIGEDGANLINRSTPIAFIAQGKYWVNNHAHVLDGISLDFLRYIELFINAIDLKPYVTGTAQPKMNQAKMNSIPIALPPLAEQRRIVGKVDQLLGLCDELAARQAARREARSALVGATLDRLVSARSAAEFPAHAHRLRDHFDRLFDTPTTLPQLRQAILQLAVQGQLVPQDPNDKPATQLLAQIKSERVKLVTEKKISKSEPTPPVNESQMLFSIPDTWCWVRLPDVCHVITDGEHLTPHYAETGIPMLSAKHVGSHSLLLEDFKLVSDATAAKCWSRCCPDERDILVVSRGGGVGRTIISGRRDYCLMGSVLLFKLVSQVDERFLCYFLNSTQGNERLRTTSGASAQQAIYNSAPQTRLRCPAAAAVRAKADRVKGDRVDVTVRRLGSQANAGRDRQHPTPLRRRPSLAQPRSPQWVNPRTPA